MDSDVVFAEEVVQATIRFKSTKNIEVTDGFNWNVANLPIGFVAFTILGIRRDKAEGVVFSN